MSRAYSFIISVVFIVIGAVLAIGGDTVGLAFIDLPFWRPLGATMVVIGLVRAMVLLWIGGRSVVAPQTRPTKEPATLLMKAPRFGSDRRSGQASRLVIGT